MAMPLAHTNIARERTGVQKPPIDLIGKLLDCTASSDSSSKRVREGDYMSKYRRLSEDEFPALCELYRSFYLCLILKNPDGHGSKAFRDPRGQDCKRNDPRTLLDSWFAYSRGRLYLKSTGSVQWFNHKDLEKPRLREAVVGMHFVSEDAWNVLFGKAPSQGLVKDHAVPVKVLRREIKEKNFQDIAELEQFLIDRYRLGVITNSENAKLRGGLAHELPDNDRSEYARYNDPRVRIKQSIEHVNLLHK